MHHSRRFTLFYFVGLTALAISNKARDVAKHSGPIEFSGGLCDGFRDSEMPGDRFFVHAPYHPGAFLGRIASIVLGAESRGNLNRGVRDRTVVFAECNNLVVCGD
ncbi:hypothetical protein P5V15_015466 [Pogonomyrmex californicus]